MQHQASGLSMPGGTQGNHLEVAAQVPHSAIDPNIDSPNPTKNNDDAAASFLEPNL